MKRGGLGGEAVAFEVLDRFVLFFFCFEAFPGADRVAAFFFFFGTGGLLSDGHPGGQ